MLLRRNIGENELATAFVFQYWLCRFYYYRFRFKSKIQQAC